MQSRFEYWTFTYRIHLNTSLYVSGFQMINLFYHLNSRFVQYSDHHCILKTEQNRSIAQNKFDSVCHAKWTQDWTNRIHAKTKQKHNLSIKVFYWGNLISAVLYLYVYHLEIISDLSNMVIRSQTNKTLCWYFKYEALEKCFILKSYLFSNVTFYQI